MRKILFLFLTIAWMIVIFSFSSKPAEESNEISLSVGYKIGQRFITDFESWAIEEQETFAEKINHPVRKCAHLTEYAILGVLLAGTMTGTTKKVNKQITEKELDVPPFFKTPYPVCFIIGVLYAASDELHQVFIPGRAGRITDILIDSSGVFIGLFITWFFFMLQKRIRAGT